MYKKRQKGVTMKMFSLKHLSVIGIVSGMLLVNGCTTEERAFVTGAAVGAIVVASFDHPRYHDRPYYFYKERRMK